MSPANLKVKKNQYGNVALANPQKNASNPKNASSSSSVLSAPSLSFGPLKKYFVSHKKETAALAFVVGTLAYFTSNTLGCTPSNCWTITGSLNPISTSSEHQKLCSFLMNLKGESPFDPLTGKIAFEEGTYRLVHPQKAALLPLLIHNNCQREVQGFSSYIFDPGLSFDSLTSVIFAAAASHNIDLWNELTLALFRNEVFNALDSEQRLHKMNAIYEISVLTSKREPSTGMCLINAGHKIGTAFDPSISVQELFNSINFSKEIENSRFFTSMVKLAATHFGKEVIEGEIESDSSNIKATIGEIKRRIQQFSFSEEVINQIIKAYPEVKRYFRPS